MTRIATALTAALAGLVIASCGGDDGEPIPARDAAQLEKLLQQVQAQAAEGSCTQLERRTIPRLAQEARGLPASVSEDTRETIEDGVAHLRDLAEEECAEERRKPDDTTTTDETTTEETTPPTTTPTTTPETTTTEDPTTTDEPTTTETEPPPPPEPPEPGTGNGGGEGNGGVSPGDGGTGGTPPGLERNGKAKDEKDGK